MNPFEQMSLKQNSFTPTDQQVHEAVMGNLAGIMTGSATAFAEEVGVSQAALTRYCKKLGYQGFSDFRIALFQYRNLAAVEEDPATVVECYTKLLQLIPAAMDEAGAEDLAARLTGARTVYTTGFHKSGLSAQLLYLDLAKLGIRSSFVPYDYFSSVEQTFCNEDVLVIFSAQSRSYKNDLSRLREHPAGQQPYVVLVAIDPKHPIRNLVDQVVLLPNHETQRYRQTLETQIVFMVFSDLLTGIIARAGQDPLPNEST